MSERYLSRGKRIDNGEWVEGYYLEGSAGDTYIAETTDIPFADFDFIPIDPATLGRCTGLRDKSGALIFEGDIVRVDCKGKADICAIRWEHGGWRIFGDFFDVEPLADLMATERQIIGNIHDNSELPEAKA